MSEPAKREIKTETTPVIRFTLEYDCERLQQDPQVTQQLLPPQVSGFRVATRRFTRRCTPEGGTPKGHWCTQEVWRVEIEYDLHSDVDPDALSHESPFKVAEIACECECFPLEGQVCVSGKDIASTGLQCPGDECYTEYTVEYTAAIEGRPSQSWIETERSVGDRSWYGYYFGHCVTGEEPAAVCQEFAEKGVSPPGCLATTEPVG